MEHKKELQDYIDTLATRKGSDIHLVAGSKPLFRITRELTPFIQKEPLKPEDTEAFFHAIAGSAVQQYEDRFREKNQLLFSYQHKTTDGKRVNFRVTAYQEMKQMAIAMRLVEETEKTIESLNLPLILKTVMAEPRGLFLIVGPASNGKSTTLAAMINHCNAMYRKHILTIEDPVEFLFTDRKSIITQREVPFDTPDFETGLTSALRADADILMIGEMRTTETMQAVMTAAEVGHLALSTVHANSAAGTVHRIVDSFRENRQKQIAQQLAAALLGICSITLLPDRTGGLIPVCEILLNNSAVANLIRESRIADLETVIQTNKDLGMISQEQALATLVRNNQISLETAHLHAKDEQTLKRYL